MTGTSAQLVRSQPIGVADLRGQTAAGRRKWVIPGADELFRSLYTGFEAASRASLAVCSAISGEGKTTVSLGLATAIAEDMPERRVVIIEADLWRPVLAKDFGLEPAPGLVDCLLDRQSVSGALRPTTLDNLSLLLAGSAAANAQQLLRSARMPQIVAELRRSHDIVIMDLPATLAHSEVSLLVRMVEDVVFVVRTGVTPVRDVTSALGKLQGCRLRGIIVNDARSSVPAAVRQLVGL